MILKRGSKGPDVVKLQKLLGVEADGIFGAGTEKEVKKLQAENDITADGIVGQKTYEIFGLDTDESEWDAATDRDDKLERLGKYTTVHGLEIDRS